MLDRRLGAKGMNTPVRRPPSATAAPATAGAAGPAAPRQRPILVIDSGLGGLTVASALRRRLPGEDLCYFGDTARLPYGSKSPQTITRFVREIIRWSLQHDPKHVVIACNTASALALPDVRRDFPGLGITGVVEPGARAAVEAAGNAQFPLIGVIATEATIRSKAYERAIHQRRHQARILLRATPLLVPIIEEGRTEEDPLVALAIQQYLRPMIDRGIEVLVLGCTHYPLLRDAMRKVVGPAVAVIDSAEQAAEDVARKLSTANLLHSAAGVAGAGAAGPGGAMRCYVSDDPGRFARLASRFLGHDIAEPELVPPEDLYARSTPAVVARAG
jgi:glutamate racemase